MPNFAFPDFDYEMPVVAGMTDQSWKNDVCPRLASEDDRLTLWCDYADIAQREDEHMKRFVLVVGEYGAGDEQVTLYEGEDLDEALATLWRTLRWTISDHHDREGNAYFEASVYIPDNADGIGADLAEKIFYNRDEAVAWLSATYPAVDEA